MEVTISMKKDAIFVSKKGSFYPVLCVLRDSLSGIPNAQKISEVTLDLTFFYVLKICRRQKDN